MNYDIFNGDADGIIALLQLQLAYPTDSIKVTGVKRDIQLLKRVNAAPGDCIRVLDISMDKNKDALIKALNDGASVLYFDHHKTGEIPSHDNLTIHVDTEPNTCTSLIVSAQLNHQYHTWAIAAAYGDNLIARADDEANRLGLSDSQKEKLRTLGTVINYNGYGEAISDLHIHPADLFDTLLKYPCPFAVINEPNSIYHQLLKAYEAEIQSAQNASVLHECSVVKVVLLDNAPWSRRISGVYGNELANLSPEKAHLILTHKTNDTYVVSLRAPLNNKQGAGEICSQFETGGGREAAGGINQLEKLDLSRLIQTVVDYYYPKTTF